MTDEQFTQICKTIDDTLKKVTQLRATVREATQKLSETNQELKKAAIIDHSAQTCHP